jgi:hypothetical protein
MHGGRQIGDAYVTAPRNAGLIVARNSLQRESHSGLEVSDWRMSGILVSAIQDVPVSRARSNFSIQSVSNLLAGIGWAI